MIAFVQPLPLNAPSGASKLLRGLLQGDHPPVISVDIGFVRIPGPPDIIEISLPYRPSFGRLEHTRFHPAFWALDGVFRYLFEHRLRGVFQKYHVQAVHTIPHRYDFLSVVKVASELRIPYFLSIHDDFELVSRRHPLLRQAITALGRAWRNAHGVYAISDEIGREYCRRFGEREYLIVTDGLTALAEAPRNRPSTSLRVYFMGLFHLTYIPNFRALLDALRILRDRHPEWNISMTCRCGSLSVPTCPEDVPLTVLPFAPSESAVDDDLHSADVLYQPMPFGAEQASFAKFSLSTKMVTYLGSGLPILYHGPQDSAAHKLLAGHRAAVTCPTLDAAKVADALEEAIKNREAIVKNAMELARSRFMLADIQKRFWQPITEAIEPDLS